MTEIVPPDPKLQLLDRQPALRIIERDLASGAISMQQAVEMVTPILDDEPRMRVGVEAQAGSLREGVAMMLKYWLAEARRSASTELEIASQATQ